MTAPFLSQSYHHMSLTSCLHTVIHTTLVVCSLHNFSSHSASHTARQLSTSSHHRHLTAFNALHSGQAEKVLSHCSTVNMQQMLFLLAVREPASFMHKWINCRHHDLEWSSYKTFNLHFTQQDIFLLRVIITSAICHCPSFILILQNSWILHLHQHYYVSCSSDLTDTWIWSLSTRDLCQMTSWVLIRTIKQDVLMIRLIQWHHSLSCMSSVLQFINSWWSLSSWTGLRVLESKLDIESSSGI
jgi:hypothetical protein